MKRTFAWWSLAEHFCASLTTPKTDIARSDYDVDAIVRASWLWQRGHAWSGKVAAAWLGSRCRRLVQSIAGSRTAPPPRYR